MANDRYAVMCDVPQGDTPIGTNCTYSYELRTDTGLLPPLSIEDAGTIAVAILVCWVTAWGLRQLVRTINQS